MPDSKRPAVFVDRDNTLIHDPGYLRHADHVRLLAGVGEAVAQLRNAGFPVVVVTNQSGVARGYLTEEELAAVHQRMQELLQAAGSGVDAIYFCPYLTGPDAIVEEYRKDSDLRKPRPGMLQRAAIDMNLDLSASWMIGDSERDIQAGKAVGCRTILMGNGNLASDPPPDFTAASFAKAAEVVLKETKRRAQSALPKPSIPKATSNLEVVVSVGSPGHPATKPGTAVHQRREESSSGGTATLVAGSVPVAESQARVLEPRTPSAPSAETTSGQKKDESPKPGRPTEPSSPAPVSPPRATTPESTPPAPAPTPSAQNESSPRKTVSSHEPKGTAAPKAPPQPEPAEQGGGKITGDPLPSSVVQPPRKEGDAAAAPATDVTPTPPAHHDPTIGDVLEELRSLKRDQRYRDFSFAQLSGAIAQAFAVCALGFGLHAMIDGDTATASPRFLLAIVLQLMAITGFILPRK